MKFFNFFDKSKFALLATGSANWDYYLMQHIDSEPSVVCIAKTGSGATDCFYGSLGYYNKRRKLDPQF